MNIRSLTRGDGAVIGAALLLFIASFLDFYTADCEGDFCDGVEMPNAWDTDALLVVLPAVFLLGVLAAVVIVVGRFVPQVKVGGLTLSQFGIPLAVASLWSALWSMVVGPEQAQLGIGAILGLLATLVLAAAAVLTEQVPALKASLIPASGPKPAAPYGQQPPGGYGQPGYGGGDHPRGTLVLVLGILSLVCCGLFTGIPAIIMGKGALEEIDRSPGTYTNRGAIKAGYICGIIGTALSALGIVLNVVLLAAGASLY